MRRGPATVVRSSSTNYTEDCITCLTEHQLLKNKTEIVNTMETLF